MSDRISRLSTLVSLLPRLLAFIWRTSPFLTSVAVLLAIGNAAVVPSQIWLTKVIIDRIAENVSSAIEGSYALTNFVLPVAGIVGVWILGVVAQSLAVHVRRLLGQRSSHRARMQVFAKMAVLDPALLETPAVHDSFNNALEETEQVHETAFFVFGWISDLLSLIAIIGLLAHIHPGAVVVIVLTSAPGAIAQAGFLARYYNIVRERSELRRRIQYLGDLLSNAPGLRELRLFGLVEYLLDQYRRLWKVQHADDRNHWLRLGRTDLLYGLLSVAGTLTIWCYAIFRGLMGMITIGDVSLAFQAAEQGRSRFSNTFSSGARGFERLLYASNLFEFLDREWEDAEGKLQSPSTKGVAIPKPIQKGIEFRDVSFRYPGSNEYVLRNVSYDLPAGHTTAIVGPNGAGKTTLIKLLIRLYDPTEGTILVDGIDLREIEPEAWWRHVSVIFQDFQRYNLSARENIGFGELQHLHNNDNLMQAARLAGAETLIQQFPRGLDTMFGRMFSDGIEISGGEWQRIALSRAFIRDAQIIVLDEPTAALDAFTEREIYEGFARAIVGKTGLLISHRFSTVRMADSILVLEEGQLVEHGTHEQLVSTNGLYAEMFTTQASQYR